MVGCRRLPVSQKTTRGDRKLSSAHSLKRACLTVRNARGVEVLSLIRQEDDPKRKPAAKPPNRDEAADLLVVAHRGAQRRVRPSLCKRLPQRIDRLLLTPIQLFLEWLQNLLRVGSGGVALGEGACGQLKRVGAALDVAEAAVCISRCASVREKQGGQRAL